MTKEQLEKANKLTSRIEDVNRSINVINDPINDVEINTRIEGCRCNTVKNEFDSNDIIMNHRGAYDEIFLAEITKLTKGYVKNVNDLLKNQLDSLERQLKEI